MGFDPNEPEQRRKLRDALKAADITRGELWLNYFSIGGSVGEYEVEAYLQGLLSLPPIQRDLLAMAANELIEALPRLYAPFSDDPDLTEPGLAGPNLAGPGRGRDTGDDDRETYSRGQDTDQDTHSRPGPDDYTDPPADK
ncbi:hypothetical protein [Arthrobacter oryzae]|uniref:hypothetical protein n=1 Tax=Arthrobacter oryzae TaxID=409290 RepID=UPI002864AC4A|nr:hypothetical protein [Arthrobacter oryzae]MDR6505065.1 hypothetical protein [Arthrobacter oryzae]